jgi:hypothetical protein
MVNRPSAPHIGTCPSPRLVHDLLNVIATDQLTTAILDD